MCSEYQINQTLTFTYHEKFCFSYTLRKFKTETVVFQRSCDVDVAHDLAYKALRQVITSWGLFRRRKRHCLIVYALTNRSPGTILT